MKLEAEGAEYEVLLGLGEIKPKKIAIDVSAERLNSDPILLVSLHLKNLGYSILKRGTVLFALLN